VFTGQCEPFTKTDELICSIFLKQRSKQMHQYAFVYQILKNDFCEGNLMRSSESDERKEQEWMDSIYRKEIVKKIKGIKIKNNEKLFEKVQKNY